MLPAPVVFEEEKENTQKHKNQVKSAPVQQQQQPLSENTKTPKQSTTNGSSSHIHITLKTSSDNLKDGKKKRGKGAYRNNNINTTRAKGKANTVGQTRTQPISAQ